MSSPQFKFIATVFDDVFIIEKSAFIDKRGVFIKSYHEQIFEEHGINCNFKESYYSVSPKNVLRGMHYQRFPYGQAKLINVIEGEVLDVIVNINESDEKNFGKFFSTILSKKNNRSLFIPEGYAHGFLVLSDIAIVVNNATTLYNENSDTGVRYDSFGFEWPSYELILSDRDKALLPYRRIKT